MRGPLGASLNRLRSMRKVQTDDLSPRLLLNHPLLSTFLTLSEATGVSSDGGLHHDLVDGFCEEVVANLARRDGSPIWFSP